MRPIVLAVCITGMSTTLFAATEEETACIDTATKSIHNVFTHLDTAKDLSKASGRRAALRAKFETLRALHDINVTKRKLRRCDMFNGRAGVVDDFKRLASFDPIGLSKVFIRIIIGNPFGGIFGRILTPTLTKEEILFQRTLIVFGSGSLVASTLYNRPIPFLGRVLPPGTMESIQDIFTSLGLTKVDFARLMLSRLESGMAI